mgnify:CR=1 FL=1
MWRGAGYSSTFYRKFFLSELNSLGDSLAKTAYNLVKHGRFSFHDVLIMTGEERSEFMQLLIDENQKEKEQLDAAKTSK